MINSEEDFGLSNAI